MVQSYISFLKAIKMYVLLLFNKGYNTLSDVTGQRQIRKKKEVKMRTGESQNLHDKRNNK